MLRTDRGGQPEKKNADGWEVYPNTPGVRIAKGGGTPRDLFLTAVGLLVGKFTRGRWPAGLLETVTQSARPLAWRPVLFASRHVEEIDTPRFEEARERSDGTE
jgi:hypothetical protein